ncbi:MAG TPA: hypothetical protein VNZ56_14350 [Verrucomicrobiae bacterium]|jgi:hypothetical protein|nr:hypothetical protein [Verrucomicrobiae bacterium]
MDAVYYEWIKIAILIYVIALLSQILRYMKMIWGKIFDIHIAVVRKEDPKRWGGEG